MKGPMNPEMKEGDRIICYHMEGELAVPPGTKGHVIKIVTDPFAPDEKIIEVRWDNGSSLSLLTSTDFWKKIPEEIKEARDPNWEFITSNTDLYKYFDWRWIREFLKDIRDSGFINMFEASPFLYSGKEHIDRYYGEFREDDENFQKVLDKADQSRDKIVMGVLNYMIENNRDLDNMDLVNRYARHFSQKLLGLYIALAGITGRV